MERFLGSVRSIILLAVLGFLLFFGTAGWLGKQFLSDNDRTQTLLSHTNQVISTIFEARLFLSREQLYSRVFAMSGNAKDAEVAQDAGKRAIETIEQLRGLTADNRDQVRRFDEAKALAADIIAIDDQIIDAARSEDSEAARDLVLSATDQGPAFRAKMDEAVSAERTLLADREAATQATLQRIIWLLAGVAALAALCGLLAVWAFSRQVRTDQRRYRELERAKQQSDDAARALAESQAQTQAVLDSARDPILVVDPDGIIEMANRACADAFGGDNLVGDSVTTLIPTLKPGQRPAGEVEVTRHDGSGFPAEVSTGVFDRDGRERLVCILRDVTERHRLDQLKNEFVSTVSHELRTPLTSIRGSLGLIVAGAAGAVPEKAQSLLEIAHKNSERLVGLVNDILDIEKIESGRMEFRQDRLDAGVLVGQAVEANQAYAAQHHVDYRVVSDGVGVTLPVQGDADRLIQVLTNLLSNAAKFSPSGGVVDVTVEGSGGQVRIGVRDRGAGIPEAFRSRIFQRFAQADASDVRRKGGTGLGLSIAKAIVERHGGRIGFEAAEGGGTRFWFTLPLVSAGPVTLSDPGVAPDGERRVLVCEDDPDVATLLALMIQQDGWRVDVAHDGETALEKARSGHYAAMTVDLLLPGMDGITLIRHLRADPATVDLPVVVVSATAQDGKQALKGDAVNIVDWLDKPIEQLRLRSALRQAGLRNRDGRARILHVEDDDDVIQVVGAIIRDEADIVPARSLAEARKKLAEQRYDLVIIDVGLPDGSGLDLLETINARTPREPVLIFSAQDSSNAFANAVSASLVKSRTNNTQLHQTIIGLINGLTQNRQEDTDHGR